MSAICGFWLRDGEPASALAISAMMATLSHRGIDGHGTWSGGAIAFGHQMFGITPESQYETLPFHDLERQLTITADARIDNRDELFSLLGIPAHEALDLPDSALILRAYAKWGERCIERLEGAFAFAIWDASERKLLCVTDPMGSIPLFYFCDARRFVFASEIKGVLGAPGVPRRLNEERLFGLAVPAFYYTELDATHFKEIRRMAPATTITVSEDGFRENEYWRPDPERRLPFKTDDEILEALCELLFRTMRSYTRNRFPVMATLSGGLDSSAVVSVVSRLLAETGRSLTAVCAVLPRNASSGFEDERNYIHCFENWDNLKLLYDCAPGRGPFENVAETVWGADSPAISPHHYQISSYADVARAHGSRLILHGIGGEVGLTSKATGYLAELLCSGHLTQVWREASAQARREERSLWGLLLREVVRPSLPQSWIRLIRPASSRDFLKPNGFPFSSCFMQRLLDHKVDHIQKLTRVQQSGFPDHRANQLNAILGMRRFSGVINAHAGYQHVGHAFPLADRRIVEFCLAAPGRLKMRDGYTRNLVRGALSNLLPSVIQRRTTKGSAVLDIAERYNRQLPAIRAELSAISNADPVRTIVDVDQLRILAASDLPTSEAAWNEIDKLANLWLVPSSIYLMQFLRQFNEFR